jgi:citrate synthase
MSQVKEYSPGLEGVVAGVTAISEVEPTKQRLAYRGYDIGDLALSTSFEEVAYLLLEGDLPNSQRLAEFSADIASERHIPSEIVEIISRISQGDPMDVLRTCVSALALYDPDGGLSTREANIRKAKRLMAKIPTILASAYRIKYGLKPVTPSRELSQAANLLYLISGAEPEDYKVRTMDTSLILYAEHGFNASTFVARVIASTLSDMHAAVCGAIGALKGPLHGGANERAMEMMMKIGEPDKAEIWIMDALARKERIMGFGHRIYRSGDSRVPTMKRVSKELSERMGEMKWYRMAEIIEQVMERERKLYANVDFSCGFTYYLLGLPIELYTPIFASSRIAGWAAHVIEQLGDNRLIRPDSMYNGQRSRSFVPIQQRT